MWDASLELLGNKARAVRRKAALRLEYLCNLT